MVDPHDAELMGRWQRGAAAFERWLAAGSRPVRVSCTGSPAARVGPRPVPGGLSALYSSPESYRESGHFAAWLYRIALNVARDAARRRPPPAPLAEGQEPADPSAAAEAVCEQRELAGLVAGAVAELPESLRLVLALHHDEETELQGNQPADGDAGQHAQVALCGRPAPAARPSGARRLRSRGGPRMNCIEVRDDLPELACGTLADDRKARWNGIWRVVPAAVASGPG